MPLPTCDAHARQDRGVSRASNTRGRRRPRSLARRQNRGGGEFHRPRIGTGCPVRLRQNRSRIPAGDLCPRGHTHFPPRRRPEWRRAFGIGSAFFDPLRRARSRSVVTSLSPRMFTRQRFAFLGHRVSVLQRICHRNHGGIRGEKPMDCGRVPADRGKVRGDSVRVESVGVAKPSLRRMKLGGFVFAFGAAAADFLEPPPHTFPRIFRENLIRQGKENVFFFPDVIP